MPSGIPVLFLLLLAAVLMPSGWALIAHRGSPDHLWEVKIRLTTGTAGFTLKNQ
jgi:hypothetical protein